MVTLLPLPPNCKPFQIHYQMYLIRISLNFNTCSLVVSCFYTYFSRSLLFQDMFTKDLRLKHEYGFFMSCIHTISFLCGVPKREYADISSGVSRVVLKGVSKSRKFKWLVKVGACKDVNPLI